MQSEETNTQSALRTTTRAGGLGPKQRAWCDRHLPNFRHFRQQVARSTAQTEASRAAVEKRRA